MVYTIGRAGFRWDEAWDELRICGGYVEIFWCVPSTSSLWYLSTTRRRIGTSIQVFGAVVSSDGNPVSQYYVDGQYVTTYTGQPSGGNTYNVQFMSKSGLSPGSHELLIQNLNGGNGQIFWLDYLLVDPDTRPADPPPPPPSKTSTSHQSKPTSTSKKPQQPESSRTTSTNRPATTTSSHVPPTSSSTSSRSSPDPSQSSGHSDLSQSSDGSFTTSPTSRSPRECGAW